MKFIRAKAYMYIIVVMFIWGTASVVIKLTLNGLEPIPFLAYRFLINTAFTLPFLPGIIHLLRKERSTKLLIILYALLSCPIALGVLFVGLNETSVVNSALLSAAEPVILAIIGAKLFHDHLSRKARIGVGITLLGVILTTAEPLLYSYDGGTFGGNILIGIYLAIDILCVVLLKKLLKRNVDPLALTQLSFVSGALVFLPLSFLRYEPSGFIHMLTNLSFKYHIGVFYMALLSGLVAYTLRAKAQKTLNISELSIFGYLSPVITTLLALLVLSEHISALYVFGALLIGIGVFVVETKRHHGKPTHRLRK